MTMIFNKLQGKTGISAGTLMDLHLLGQLIDNPDLRLTTQQMKSINSMLEKMVSNKSYNKKFDALMQLDESKSVIDYKLINYMKALSFRTRHLNEIDSDLDTIWMNFQSAKNENKDLKEEEKITLKQYGILYDLAMINKDLEKFKKLGLIKNNDVLNNLYSQTQRAAEIISHLDKTFGHHFKALSGTLVLNNTEKQTQLFNQTLSFFEYIITFFISKFTHTNPIEVHHHYSQNKHNLSSFLYSDRYRIKLENLINEDTKALLKDHLGRDWLGLIELQFASIERTIHDNKLKGHFDATVDEAQIALVLAAPLLGGHKNFFMQDHDNSEIRDEIMGKKKWDQKERLSSGNLLCSEFVGKTIIASVHELNDSIKLMLQKKGVENIPDIIVKNPISEKEKLYLLTPERLVQAMEERGAIVQLKTPKKLSQFIVTAEAERDKNDHSDDDDDTMEMPNF